MNKNEELKELVESLKKAEELASEKDKEKIKKVSDDIIKSLDSNNDFDIKFDDKLDDSKKVVKIKDDKGLSTKAKRIIAGITAGAVIAVIALEARSCTKKKNYTDITKATNKDNSSYSVVIENENSVDSLENTKSFDATNDEQVKEKAQKIIGYINGYNMEYNLDFIEDVVRILNEVEPKNKNVTIGDVIDFLDNWANKCIINTSNYIGGVEEFNENTPEIHYAEFFDENSIDYEAINNYDEMVNKATHSKDFDDIYDASNEMLKEFYEVIELDGKETEYGLANRNSLSKGGIAVLETEIVDTLPILEETDSKKNLNWSNYNAVVDQDENELENHGYNNDEVNGINIIKLRLNPLSKEEYEYYFQSIFEDVYGINYSKVKKIAAKSLTTHENNTTEIPDYAFYKNLKQVIGEQTRVEYENQMLDMEALTRLFYSYYTGEIQTAEESDLNQDLRELEQIRIENCKVKTK